MLSKQFSQLFSVSSKFLLRSLPSVVITSPIRNFSILQNPKKINLLPTQLNVYKFSTSNQSDDGKEITVQFIQKDNTTKDVTAKIGQTILEVAKDNDIDLEGACEGSQACSTCHVILEHQFYEKLKPPTEDEEDLLDLAFGLTETSRLGCQLTVTKDFQNAVFTLPKETRNILNQNEKDKAKEKAETKKKDEERDGDKKNSD